MENNTHSLSEESQAPSEQYLNFVAYAYVDGELLINYEMLAASEPFIETE